MFIVLEGIDGCGKSTQSRRLVDHLNRAGKFAVLYMFPRRQAVPLGPPISKHLRGETYYTDTDSPVSGQANRSKYDALVLQSLITLDKYDVSDEIEKHLHEGAFVVADRWWQSAYAYGRVDGLDSDWLIRVNKRLPRADLNLLLDLDASQRWRVDMNELYERDSEKQQRIASFYRDLWDNFGDDLEEDFDAWPKISAVGSYDEVFGRILESLKARKISGI